MYSRKLFLSALLIAGSLFAGHAAATPKAAEDEHAQVTIGAPVKPPKAGAKTEKKQAAKPKSANVSKTPHSTKTQTKNSKKSKK